MTDWKTLGLFGAGKDVTEPRQTEQAPEFQNSLVRAIQEVRSSAPDAASKRLGFSRHPEQ
jgi:hypothetical protein